MSFNGTLLYYCQSQQLDGTDGSGRSPPPSDWTDSPRLSSYNLTHWKQPCIAQIQMFNLELNRNLSLNSGPNPLFVFRTIQYPGFVQKKPAACHRFEFRFSTSSLSLMDLIAAPDTAEAYTLRTISRPYEIEKWTSHAVRMRISRTIAGGFGTVYCVFAHPSKWRVLISTIVVRRKHSGCIPLLK